MLINYSDFNISGSRPLPQKEEAAKSGEAGEKGRFHLAGVTDLFQALPRKSEKSDGTGPVYPTVGTRLFPALDSMEKIMKELGKHPTPEEVDSSNVRRLIRAFQPVAEAFQGSYDAKPFDKAMGQFTSLAGSLGKFKDVAVIRKEVQELFPGGVLPGKIDKKLAKYHDRQEEKFLDTFKDFRKEGLHKAIKVLSNPYSPDESSPKKIEKEDREIFRGYLKDMVSDVDNAGICHDDPDTFHDGRKKLRKLLNGVQSARDLFPFSGEDLDKATKVVGTFGQAQDKYIAYEWLKDSGFESEAKVMLSRYNEDQQVALKQGGEFMKSGVTERMKEALSQ